jgi:hypothetical protein
MKKQITVNLAALVLGTALVSVPAFAQKAANDGGSITEPSGSAAQQASEPPTGSACIISHLIPCLSSGRLPGRPGPSPRTTAGRCKLARSDQGQS